MFCLIDQLEKLNLSSNQQIHMYRPKQNGHHCYGHVLPFPRTCESKLWLKGETKKFALKEFVIKNFQVKKNIQIKQNILKNEIPTKA